MFDRSLLSKLMSPALPPTILYRQALVEELAQAVTGSPGQAEGAARGTGYKVILLCAPGGYGKTTLLADFARRASVPCCWYFLDATDEDRISFLTLLLVSIRQQFPQFGFSLEGALRNLATIENLAQKNHHIELFIHKLTNGIATEIPEPFALFLCDYQELDGNGATNLLINLLIQRLPPQCTLILESRSTPNLEFISLLARGHISGIGSDKLRFSAQEIGELAHLQHIDLTDQEARLLEQSFEGWITGILLGTHLGGLQKPLSTLSSHLAGSSPFVKPGREHLFAYLVKNIFAHESGAYHFLKETAVLRQMTPILCNALLDISDSASRLADLERQGLFVTHYQIDGEHVFVCHPILRELLYDELQSQVPAHLTELHLRAVELLRGKQNDEAITHALTARDFASAARLIEAMVTPQFAQGHLTTLAHWLDSLPAEVLNEYPRLLLARANLFLEECALTKVQPLLEQALANAPDSPLLRAEILLAQANLLMQRGDYTQAQGLSRQALLLLPVDEIASRAVAHRLLGSCAAFLNNFTAGIAELQQALQLYGPTTRTRQVAKLHTMLADYYGVTDLNALSEHHRMRAIQYWEDLSDEWGRIDNLVGLGMVKARQGALVEAEYLFKQALTISHETAHYESGEAYAQANLGDIYQDQDKFRQALVAYEDGLVLSRQLDDAYLTQIIICHQARTHQLMGDSHGALSILAQLDQHIPSLESENTYEQAFYYLTLGTILLQTGDLAGASTSLTAAKRAFADIRYEQIQAMIQLAACLLAQNKFQAAQEETAEALLLAEEYSYEELAQREIARCPDLLTYLKTSLPLALQRPQALQKSSAAFLPSRGQPAEPGLALPQTRPVLRIQALGIPEVYRDDLLIKQWRMARSMELFFLLLNASHPLHKEQIITTLWRDGDLPTDPTWRSTVHYLRKALHPDCLAVLHGVYSLQLTAMFTVKYDVADFQHYAAQARIAQEREDLAATQQALENMLELYRGDFVSSFYNDWCIPRRTELRQFCLDAHRQLALLAWQQQQLEKSILHWQHIVAMDNMLEFAHEGLMRCYIRQGKRNQALRQYNDYAALLQDELGMPPGRSLQLLQQQIAQKPLTD